MGCLLAQFDFCTVRCVTGGAEMDDSSFLDQKSQLSFAVLHLQTESKIASLDLTSPTEFELELDHSCSLPAFPAPWLPQQRSWCASSMEPPDLYRSGR